MTRHYLRGPFALVLVGAIILIASSLVHTRAEAAQAGATEFNDSHFHLTNYIQEGIDIHQFLQILGHRDSRSTLFGILLQ